MNRRVLVLGAYGMIGSACVQRLQREGHQVTGLGRSLRTAKRVFPELDWEIRDLRDMCDQRQWEPLVGRFDYVVNCAGALQDTPEDDVATVQRDSIVALCRAAQGSSCALVQISAVGVSLTSETGFYSSKAQADQAIMESDLEWWVFRPGLVIGPSSYGGTTLLRMLAAVPFVGLSALPDAKIQTVALDDISAAVADAVAGRLEPRRSYDLVEEDTHRLEEVVARLRNWLGFEPARWRVAMPDFLLRPVSGVSDALGRLGWRSPLRTTALTVLKSGIVGDAEPFRRTVGQLKSLDETLAAMPARPEDRLAARMHLMMPLVVAVLFGFWLVSGLVGLLRASIAAETLIDAGWSPAWSMVSALVWSFVDIGLALLLCWRRWAQFACLGMCAVALFYLGAATWWTPELWVDPLGPLVKVIPAICLSLIGAVLLERR